LKLFNNIRFEVKIVSSYILFGALWILLSDTFINTIFPDLQTRAAAQMYKGWFFILITGLFLYAFIRKYVTINNKKEHYLRDNHRINQEFLQNISHEIRTPLNNIVGFTEILRKNTLTENEKAEYLEIIQDSSYNLLSIVNDIIDISQIDSGISELKEEPTNLKAFFNDILISFNEIAINKKFKFDYKCSLSDTESWVLIDQSKVYQIFLSLLNHSFKVTKSGYVKIQCYRNTNELEFCIENTGKSIPPEIVKAIFSNSDQIKSRIHKINQGIGIGLSISKVYIDAMQGSIKCDNELIQGNKFLLTIPYKPVNAPQEKTSKAKLLNNSKTTVLIAEDNELNYLYLKELLHKYNFEVIRAANGKEAVDKCKSNSNIGLVFMDIRMPILNGYEATEIIRHNRPDLPVIIQSAYAMEEDYEFGKNVGCNAYLTKPINSEKLYFVVDNLLN
jgi:signal transduction histidine kinase/CheY-like chemotaxis protein